MPVAEAALSSPSTASLGGSVSVAVQQIRAASGFCLLSPAPSAYLTTQNSAAVAVVLGGSKSGG